MEEMFDAGSFKFDDEDEQTFDAGSFDFGDEDAMEPAPQKRGVAMLPEEMNVPTAAIETKEDAEAKGGMSANEVAKRSYEQATGADAPENAVLAHLVNMGNSLGGRLNANLQMQAAQKLAEGNSRSDDETRGLFSKMMYGATKYLGASLFVDDALDEWDETEGKSYATPEERTAARNEFANELARQFIAERTATRQNATTELENRERGFVANVFGKGPEQIGNMLPYMLGPVGIALHFAEEAGAAGTGYANDEYGFAKDGSLGVVAEGDSAGRAALKGVASSAIETATELIGGKLASAVLKRGGKILVGQFPVITRSAGKIAQTKVGQTVARFGGKMKDAFKLVSKKMHWDGLPEETIEELESDMLNSLLGTGARDSEYVNAETGERLDAGGRFVEGLTNFFKPENFIELQEAMLLTMGAGGFMAHMSQRGAQKQVDSFLESKGIMDAEEIKKADLRTKVAAMDAYTKGLSEEQVREKLDTASGVIDGWNKWLDKKLTKSAGEEADTEKVVTLKNFLTEMDAYNLLVERAGEVDAVANERGETTRRFTVQTDENGAPKFNRTIVMSPATGESVTRDEMHDLDAGVTVIDTAGAYEVKSDVTGETFRTQSFNRAVNAADAMAVLNQQRIAERETKAQVLGGILNSEQYAGREFEVVETAEQARDNFGGDIENDAPGFTAADGTTVLILDNLDDPATALSALDKGTPNDRGAFADGAKFETEAATDADGEMVETRVARDKVHNVTIIDSRDGTFTVFGEGVPYTNVDSVENAIAIARGEKPSETRANEAPAQPEQREVVAPPTGAEARPVESAEARAEAADARVVAQPAVWPNGWNNAGEEIKGYVVPNDGDVAPGREVAIAHRSGGTINAPQKIKGVVESVDGDKVKVYYRDGMGYDQHDTFDKREIVGVMPLSQPAEKGVAKPLQAKNKDDFDLADLIGNPDALGNVSDAENREMNKAVVNEMLKPIRDRYAAFRKKAMEDQDFYPGITADAARRNESFYGFLQELRAEISKHKAIIDDWKSRAYKQSNKVVDVASRDEQGEMDRVSTNAINEARRRRVMEQEQRQIDKLEKNIFDALGSDYNNILLKTGERRAQSTKNSPTTAPKPTEAQTAENRAGAAQEGAGARPASETATATPAPAKPAEASSRASDEEYVPEAGRDDLKVRGTDYTVGKAKELLREDVAAKIAEAAEELGVDLKVKGLELHGSRVRGDAKKDSDLDLVVEYEGDAREDTLWEILNEKPTVFGGIKVDINPINAEKSGTLSEYMRRSAEYDAEKMARPKPDGKGEMVKPKAAESDYGVTMFEEPAVDGDGIRYVVKDGPSDAHRMMFKSKAEAEARLAELRAERKAIKESPSATLADGKKIRLLKTNVGWVPYGENYNDLRHGIFKAAKTKAEAIKVAEKGVKWARDVAEENARFKAKSASRASGVENRGDVEDIERKFREARDMAQNLLDILHRGRQEQLNLSRERYDEMKSAIADAKPVKIKGVGNGTAGIVKVGDRWRVVDLQSGFYFGDGANKADAIAESERRIGIAKERGDLERIIQEGRDAFTAAMSKYDADTSNSDIAAPKGAKSNRLRRADGTDPLAEKNPAPKTVRKAVDKISSAISNRTGTGAIMPEEADGIVRAIVESPETKHNRYRDFFNPLENDATWHESLGLDAESAKNVRDAVDRVKTDADLKKWFPQVDAAVKKAKDGRLSKKDAAPLFGKISEGLEKAERMGLSETANRLREAAEVIRPVAETVEQGDVNKFNYSTKGQKLNSRLGGTDKRGNKTVSLDTKNGTVDVRADGKGSTLGGNRHLIIDGVNGDELTVTMKDAAGKTLATRKMNRAQWSALAKGAVATDGDPANPQKGDLIRMSRSDATDAPQSWTPETQKPLERVAHALRNVVTVGGKKVKVEFLNERPADVDGQTRKSIGGIFTGSAADYANRSHQGGVDDGPSLKKIGTGEGSRVYGWGLYGSTVRGVAEGYARQGRNLNVAAGDAEYKLDGKSLDRKNDVIDSALTYLASERMNTQKAIEEVNRAIDGFKKQLEDTNERLKWDKNNFRLQMDAESLPIRISHLNEVKGFIEQYGGKIRQVLPSENIYEQTFFTNRAPGDESHLLKWYEPVSKEQREWVVDGLKDLGGRKEVVDFINRERQQDLDRDGLTWEAVEGENRAPEYYPEDILKDYLEQYLDLHSTGGELYGQLSDALGSPKAASEFLARAGIDGVKYPVDSFGGKGVKDGDKAGWNYVSFRDDNIRVDHKWTDGELRYMRNSDGVTVGEYDAANGEIRLYPGATVADVVHEFTHPLVDFARAEAKAGRGELLDKINQIIDAERATWEQPVRDAYKGKGNEAILEEIFTHAMGEKGADLFGKSTKTLQGRRWYNRLWEAIKGVWQDFATKMGWNKADLRGLDGMSPEDAAQKILSEMAKGRNFGDAVRPASSRIMDYEQTKREKFTEKFIDSFAPVKSVQDEIGGVKEVTRADGYTDHTKSTDLVAAKDRANGRIEYELRQHQFRVDDINRDLARAALPKQSTEDLVDDFNLYLQCKHAPERNRSIAQDRGDAYTPDYSEGMGQITLPGGNRIGLSENVADRLLKGMRGKYGLKFKMFENAADKIYKMLEADLDRRFDAGRLSAEDYAFYKTRWHGPGGADGKWAHYVPLKTDMERLEPEALNSSTAGMKRNEFMKAQGRGSGDIADSPLAAAVLQTEQGIRGSIKNEVANVEANLVEHAQKRGIPIAEIVPGDEIRRGRTYSFTFADGETVDASGSMRLVENHPEIHLFKRDGKLYAIRYDKGANGRGLAFAKAASGENMGRWGSGLEWIPHMTHWMSAMRTQWSPEFTVSNWLADHLEAAQALVGRYGLKDGGKAFAKTVASEIQNFKDLRAYLKDGTANGYIKEFVEGGGLTKGGVASEGFEAETQKIRSKIEQFRREQKQWREMSLADLVKSFMRNVADFLSFANELAEYSTRTGLYTALRKQNVPQAEAIKFARDATVNFNRKGTAMPYINGLYMFANASVQSEVRSVQAMRDTHGKELAAALTAIGVAKAVIDNLLGNDDEREAAGGRNARNQSEYDKKHNVGVPIGGGRQIVPLRFRGLYAAIPYLAQTAANVAMGVTSPEDGAKTLFRELGDQVTDLIGGNGIMNDRGELDGALIGQSIAPSVADPIVQLATGKDYKGDERRRKSFDKTMPASSNGKHSTASGYKWLAKGINAIPFLSGGNEFRKGRLDFAPEDYQLVLEFLGGAPMRDINNVVSSVNNAVQLASGGTPERTLSQIPFVRRIVREYPESTSRYYAALEDYERDKAEFKKTTPERREEMKADKPYLFVGKSLLDGQIELVKEYMHLERGEVKVGQKWVEPKTPRTEAKKEEWRKKRLALQAQILKRLGK